MLYDEIFKKRFNFQNSLEGKDKKEKLEELKNDIEDAYSAYSKGKIGELHYELLNKKILDIQKGINESV